MVASAVMFVFLMHTHSSYDDDVVLYSAITLCYCSMLCALEGLFRVLCGLQPTRANVFLKNKIQYCSVVDSLGFFLAGVSLVLQSEVADVDLVKFVHVLLNVYRTISTPKC